MSNVNVNAECGLLENFKIIELSDFKKYTQLFKNYLKSEAASFYFVKFSVLGNFWKSCKCADGVENAMA